MLKNIQVAQVTSLSLVGMFMSKQRTRPNNIYRCEYLTSERI
jgi:hypothetical protein